MKIREIEPDEIEELFKQLDEVFQRLDVPCYNCLGSGQYPRASGHDCSICYGTGYQPTRTGVELLNFLRRQKKRIEREGR